MQFTRFFCGLAAASMLSGAGPAVADSVSDFYSGKTIILVVSAAAGAGYDAAGRLVARHMPQHIPGHPNMIVQNMPGAAGLSAANWVANVASRDGMIISLLQRNALTAKLVGRQGVRFDPGTLNWIGNISRETTVTVAWSNSPAKTTEDLFKTELIVGATAAGNDTEAVPRLLNALIGTKFKIISGYKSTEDIVLAMDRGEVQGMGNWSLSNVMGRRASYVRDGKLRILLQVAEQRVSELPNVPSALEFVKNDQDRAVLQLFLAQKAIARPIAAPPDVPKDRVAALRKAFLEIFDDAQFRAEAEKSGIETDPSPAEEIDRTMRIIQATPEPVAKRFAEIVAP